MKPLTEFLQPPKKSPELSGITKSDSIIPKKIRIFNEEISFWENEARALQQMINLGKSELLKEKQLQLNRLSKKLTYLSHTVFPEYKNLLIETVQVGDDQVLIKLEKHHDKLRRNYNQLKKQLFPFLPSMIKVRIW
jgi:hypothetical protein